MRLYQCPVIEVRGLEKRSQGARRRRTAVPPAAPALANAIFRRDQTHPRNAFQQVHRFRVRASHEESFDRVVLAASSIAVTGFVVAKDEPRMRCRRAASAAPRGWRPGKRIEAVVTRPRCANCHVDAAAVPMWTPAGETKARVHGMNIHGGRSRIGSETIAVSTCHITSTSRTSLRRHHSAPASTGNLPQWKPASGSGKSGARSARS